MTEANTKNLKPEADVNVDNADQVQVPRSQGGRSVYGNKLEDKKRFARKPVAKDEFEQKVVDLARVTRVMGGGKRMSFRACIAIGDGKGSVGIGMAKGADVQKAITKAVNQAKKDIVNVAMVEKTIPYSILRKQGAAKILLKPAKPGHGVVAGGVVKVVLELAGIRDITSKIIGTNNKASNAKCTLEALRSLKK
ncbi:30S ribosomal protein S5 [Patescibacteria group bacterium]|nr:30S ribosomal protein S5 [Patescibacteria group bacterium]